MPVREKRVDILKGRGFESEEQLVRAIVACTKRARRREYRVELEVDAGVGVADLVLTKRAARSTAALRSLGMVSPRLAILLSREVGDPIKSWQTLAVSLGTSKEATQRVISQLTISGLAKQTRGSLDLLTVKTPSALHSPDFLQTDYCRAALGSLLVELPPISQSRPEV